MRIGRSKSVPAFLVLGSLAILDLTLSRASDPAAPAAAKPYTLAGPLRRVSAGKDKLKSEPFDLQGRIGKGKPIALFFWAPGFHQSERALVAWARFLKSETPGYEVYAVAGRSDTQRDEELFESFSMLDVPADLPLLLDDGFAVSKALDATDVPNLALLDAKGNLIISKIKDREQLVITPQGNRKAEEIVRKVAAGEEVATIKRMFPYYPAAELYGRCAPSFTLKKFGTDEPYSFSAKSASGRPTLLMFWSSTCKHCQLEIPQLVAWVKAHPDAANVVSVTHIKADRPGEASHRKITEAYIKGQGIPWTVLEDPDHAVEELYRSVSTPTTYFIAPDGTVLNAWFYAHEQGFEQALAKELARTPAAAPCKAPEAAAGARMGLDMMAPDGKRASLASLLDKPSIVHFWATWCKPCVEELPSLLRFRDKLEKSGEGRVLLVSVEDEAAGSQIAAFAKRLNLDLRSYRAPKGGLADKLDLAYRVPRSYLVAPGGVVLAARQGGQNWDDPEVAGKVLSRLKNGSAGVAP